jgi:hypothetical protein
VVQFLAIKQRFDLRIALDFLRDFTIGSMNPMAS